MMLSGSYQKNTLRFDQYSSIEINKVDTTYWGSNFGLQTFDILRPSYKKRSCQNLCFYRPKHDKQFNPGQQLTIKIYPACWSEVYPGNPCCIFCLTGAEIYPPPGGSRYRGPVGILQSHRDYPLLLVFNRDEVPWRSLSKKISEARLQIWVYSSTLRK
jgi:hypothetical protein